MDGKSDPDLRQERNKVMSRIQAGFTEAYAQTVSAVCELDLRLSDMLLAQDTLP